MEVYYTIIVVRPLKCAGERCVIVLKRNWFDYNNTITDVTQSNQNVMGCRLGL